MPAGVVHRLHDRFPAIGAGGARIRRPPIRLFSVTTRWQARRGRVMTAFLSGDLTASRASGSLPLFGDVEVHRLLTPPPAWRHGQSVGGRAVIVADVFQFSVLEDRCLAKCRHTAPTCSPAAARHRWRPSARPRPRPVLPRLLPGLDADHVRSRRRRPWWMAALTALMIYEQANRRGTHALPLAEAVLLGTAVLQLAHSGWFPNLLRAKPLAERYTTLTTTCWTALFA